LACAGNTGTHHFYSWWFRNGFLSLHEVWRRLPGLWEAQVMESNVSAYDFWVRAISILAGEAIHPVRVEKGGEGWRLFSFESKPASQPHSNHRKVHSCRKVCFRNEPFEVSIRS